MNKKLLLSLFALVGVSVCLSAADEARLLRFPATNGNEIVFSYAGDLYRVPVTGGEALDFACGLRNVPSFFTRWQNDCFYWSV